jgi:hypothetical protein
MFCTGVKLDVLYLEGSGREGAEWIYLAQNESKKEVAVNTGMNLDIHNTWELS